MKRWYIVDAKDEILGRLATKIAFILMGKHKSEYLPYVDMGDYVIVINAEKIRLTGKKLNEKKYYKHSGYPGGIKVKNAKEMLNTKPEEVLRLAVRGMLPKTILGRKMLKKLKIYRGENHPHIAQKPVVLNFEEVGLG